MWVDYGSQASAPDVVVKCFGRRPLGLVTEIGMHPRCVHDAAKTQVVELVSVDFGITISPSQRIQRPDSKTGNWQRNSASPPDRLRQHDDAVAADVERAGLAGHRRALQRT